MGHKYILSAIVSVPLIATESGDSWPGAWSSISYYTTKQGEVIGCKEGPQSDLKRIKNHQPRMSCAGLPEATCLVGSHMFYTLTSTMLGVCVQGLFPSLTRKEPGCMEEQRGRSRVPARSSFRCSHRRAWYMQRTDLQYPNG